MNRGHAAKELLEHPLLKEAFTNIKDTILETWESSTDSDVREELWHSHKAMTRLHSYLEIVLDNEKLNLHNEENS